MKKIKLKDYKGDFVCVVSIYDDVNFIESDDVETIKEYKADNFKIYGTTKEKIFGQHFINYKIQSLFESYADDNGYDDMNDSIDYNSEEFKKVKEAISKFIDSLGAINFAYYCDRNTMIEVE